MKVLLTGAAGVVGVPLAKRLEAEQHDVTRLSRSAGGEGWWTADLSDRISPPQDFECVLHAAPIWLLPRHIPVLAESGVARIVALSSTSAVTKQSSRDPKESALAESLAESERALRREAEAAGADLTILRSAMIYGYGRDENVTAIARFVKRFGFFPLAGPSAGKRQPVHAEEVAEAVCKVMATPATFGRRYDIAGGEILSYRAMVQRVCRALGKPRSAVTLPTGLLRVMSRCAAWLGLSISPGMVDRMNVDMVFDIRPATADFGFDPGPFLTHPERDLINI